MKVKITIELTDGFLKYDYDEENVADFHGKRPATFDDIRNLVGIYNFISRPNFTQPSPEKE